MEIKKRIIDKRIKEKFLIDDLYLNGQAKICGWQATLVYLSICRHADKEQECFPSIKKIQEEIGVSRNTILKGIDSLERHNVIQVEKERNKAGKWLNNRYILIDKSEWIRVQVPVEDTAIQVPVVTQPSPCGDTAKSPTGTLRKHIEGNTYKETHIMLVDYFYELKGWTYKKNEQKVYKQFLRPAKELMELCEGNLEEAKYCLKKVADWCDSRKLSWNINTIFKKWYDIDSLQELEKKPYVDGNRAFQMSNRWYILMPNGEKKEYVGSLDNIKYK